MVSTKDLRDLFNELTNEAGKRAGDVVNKFEKADLPDLSNIGIGRRNEPPGLLWFGIGLTLGAVIGMLAAFLSTPYNGEQARKKVVEQVEKVRKSSKDDVGGVGTNGSSSYSTPTSAYERS